MTKLRAPLKDYFDDSLDTARARRMWRVVQRDRERTKPRRSRWLIGAGSALALVLSLAGVLLAVHGRDAGPLAAHGGGAVALNHADVALSDGSQIVLAPGAELGLVENTGSAFALQLRRGRARFDVTPGGPRRWWIDCGLATVTVVGTEFTIDRGANDLRVEVWRGIVEVRGAGVAGGVRRLSAGEVMSLDADGGAQPARLLEQADRARSRGSRAEAIALLRRVMRENAGTSEAAIAGFSLARLQMQDDPDAAAAALRASLAASTPKSLREDVLARLVEAYARAGKREEAERAAREYRREYPEGRRLAEVERWAAEP